MAEFELWAFIKRIRSIRQAFSKRSWHTAPYKYFSKINLHPYCGFIIQSQSRQENDALMERQTAAKNPRKFRKQIIQRFNIRVEALNFRFKPFYFWLFFHHSILIRWFKFQSISSNLLILNIIFFILFFSSHSRQLSKR